MGLLASIRATATVPIPFAEPHEVTVQKLAGRHMQKAKLAYQITWLAEVEAKGGVKKQKQRLKDWTEDDPKDEPEPKQEQDEDDEPDPLAGLDPYTLCRFGVKSLTSDDSLEEEEVVDDDGTKVTRVRLFFEMSEYELNWFATEVMRVTDPRLFQKKSKRKELEKNDCAPSLTA